MWQNIIVVPLIMLGWLLVVTAFYFYLPRLSNNKILFESRTSQTKLLLLVLLVALGVRMLPTLLLPVGAGYDIESFQLVGEALLNGEEVYTSAAIGRHPYLPMQMYWVGLAYYLSLKTAVHFVVLIKILPVLVDLGITAIIFQTCKRWQMNDAVATTWALLFALNPISILVSAYHGQFDSVPVFLLLLSWYRLEFRFSSSTSAIALGFAILNKTWPVVMLPVTLIRNLSWRYWVFYIAIALGIPVLFTIAYVEVFDSDPIPMLRRAMTHTGPNGYWGMSALLALLKNTNTVFQPIYNFMVTWRRWFILVAGLFALWWTNKETILSAIITIILSVFAVSAGMGIQWLLWVIPFAILDADHRWLGWYSLTGMVFMLAQLYGLHMHPWFHKLFGPVTADFLIRAASIPAWISVLLWVASRVKKSRSPLYNLTPVNTKG